MLNKLLEKCFNEDKAASGFDTDKIKTAVFGRIGREKPMKHFGIKAIVIAAAMMMGGLMTVIFTASAATDGNAVDQSSKVISSTSVDESNIYVSPQDIECFGKEYATKLAIQNKRDRETFTAYFEEKTAAAKENGGVIIEKELDETDVVGYVPPSSSQYYMKPSEDELEMVRRIEEEPESLGLIPAGKSETFEGGYRIVNRHYINTNEPVNGEKIYYSFRRVYTDDDENRLIASSYIGYRIYFGPRIYPDSKIYDLYESPKVKLDVFLDHTEEGCIYGLDTNIRNNGRGTGGSYSGGKGIHSDKDAETWYYSYMCLKRRPYSAPEYGHEVSDSDVVFLGNVIAVTYDHVQLMD